MSAEINASGVLFCHDAITGVQKPELDVQVVVNLQQGVRGVSWSLVSNFGGAGLPIDIVSAIGGDIYGGDITPIERSLHRDGSCLGCKHGMDQYETGRGEMCLSGPLKGKVLKVFNPLFQEVVVIPAGLCVCPAHESTK